MREFDDSVEQRLKKSAQTWEWLRFLRYSATLGIVAFLTALLIGVCAHLGWLTGRSTLGICLAGLVLATIVALLLTGLLVVLLQPKRARLVGAIERSNPRLLDRLNTLLFLNRGEETPVRESFRRRVAVQVRALLRERPLASPVAPIQAWLHLSLLAVVAIVTLWFYIAYAPLAGVASAGKAQVESPLVFPEDGPEAVEELQPWYEARIVRPGRNMEIADREMVPLQIEVSSSQPLASAAWHTAVNAGDERAHGLPHPPDPRYALYEPTINLREFDLEDWDVLTYYADAALETGDVFASDIYSIEVRPSADDLKDLPGGPEGSPLSILNQLTGLIACQQEIVRASHRQEHFPSADLQRRRNEHQWLADVEQEMAATSDHLAAQISSDFESSTVVKSTLQRLDSASDSLTLASDAFRRTGAKAGRPEAQAALRELLAARKLLYQDLSENPVAYRPGEEDTQNPDGATSGTMKEISDFLDNVDESVRSVRDLAEEQKDVVRQSRSIQSSLWSVFTTGVSNGNPVDTITEISIDSERVYLFVSWRNLSNEPHVYACKMFDGQGRCVEDDETRFTPTRRVWRVWNWHIFNRAVDAPGDWKFHAFLDGRQVIDKTLKVLPSGVKPKPPKRGPTSPRFEPVDSSARYGELARKEDSLQRDLAQLERDNREVAQRVQKESQAAHEALQQAAQSLRDKQRDARQRTESG